MENLDFLIICGIHYLWLSNEKWNLMKLTMDIEELNCAVGSHQITGVKNGIIHRLDILKIIGNIRDI